MKTKIQNSPKNVQKHETECEFENTMINRCELQTNIKLVHSTNTKTLIRSMGCKKCDQLDWKGWI